MFARNMHTLPQIAKANFYRKICSRKQNEQIKRKILKYNYTKLFDILLYSNIGFNGQGNHQILVVDLHGNLYGNILKYRIHYKNR